MLWKIRAITLLHLKICVSAADICHTPGRSSIWCVASVSRQSLDLQLWNVISVMHIHQWSDSNIPLKACAHTYTHTHNMHTTKFNIRLTGAHQDDSEDGHSKEKNNNGKNNTKCDQSWRSVSTFWTRTCGVGFNVNDKHESIWLTVWEIRYNTLIVICVYKYIMTQKFVIPTKIQDDSFVWLHHISQLPLIWLKKQPTHYWVCFNHFRGQLAINPTTSCLVHLPPVAWGRLAG